MAAWEVDPEQCSAWYSITDLDRKIAWRLILGQFVTYVEYSFEHMGQGTVLA